MPKQTWTEARSTFSSGVLLLKSVKESTPNYKLSPFKKYSIINLVKKLICEEY